MSVGGTGDGWSWVCREESIAPLLRDGTGVAQRLAGWRPYPRNLGGTLRTHHRRGFAKCTQQTNTPIRRFRSGGCRSSGVSIKQFILPLNQNMVLGCLPTKMGFSVGPPGLPDPTILLTNWVNKNCPTTGKVKTKIRLHWESQGFRSWCPPNPTCILACQAPFWVFGLLRPFRLPAGKRGRSGGSVHSGGYAAYSPSWG